MKQFNTNTRSIYRVQDLESELDQVNTILKLLNSFDLSDKEAKDLRARRSALAVFASINMATRLQIVELPTCFRDKLSAVFACVSPRCLLRSKYEAVPFQAIVYDYMYDTGKATIWSIRHKAVWKELRCSPRSLLDVDNILSTYCERSSDEIVWSQHQAFSDMHTLESYLLATVASRQVERPDVKISNNCFATLWFEYPREDFVDKVATSIYSSPVGFVKFDSLLRDAMTLYDASMFHLTTGLNVLYENGFSGTDMLLSCQKIAHCLEEITYELDSLLRKII